MVILLDEDVYDKIRKSNVSTDLSGRYVIAHRGTEYDSIELPIEDTENNMGLPIELSEVHCAKSYVVTDNEGGTDGDDPVELSCERCDSLEEAITAMVRGVEDKTEVAFYTELCADYGDHIDGIARWCHPSRFEDGKQWF